MTPTAASPTSGSPVRARGACVLLRMAGLSLAAGDRESCETRTLAKTALTWSPLQRTVAAPEPAGSVFLRPGLS